MNISEFIRNYITKKEKKVFENDLINNKEKLTKEIKGKINFGHWREPGQLGSSSIKGGIKV